MKVGDLYKNYNEKNGLFTYEVINICHDTIFMHLLYPDHWEIPPYPTKFNIDSLEKLLEKV